MVGCFSKRYLTWAVDVWLDSALSGLWREADISGVKLGTHVDVISVRKEGACVVLRAF